MKRLNTDMRRSWVARYTLLFLLIMLPMAACLLLTGKSFLWGNDAYYQQYPVLQYTSSAIRRLLSGEGFLMVDTSLGQGLDALGTLSYYGLTDPFQWLGALFSGRALEVYYHLLIFVYIYLAGLFFGLYVRRVRLVPKEDAWATVIAGLLFAFCGYQTIGIIKNPYYASGSLYLCLMLIAVERIFENRRWLMLSLMTLLMLMANFYLAYQTTLLVVLYILLRMLARLKVRGWRASMGDGFVLLGSYLLGVALSMVMLLPSAIQFLSSGRTGAAAGYTDSLLHYPPVYYLKLAMLFSAPYDYAGYWALQSFCPIALLGAIVLFRRERGLESAQARLRRQLRVGFALGVICLCVPLMGKLFNGIGYVTNRWCYGFAAIVCAVSAWAVPRFMDVEYAGRKCVARGMLAWGAAMLVYGIFAHKLPAMHGAGIAVAAGELGMRSKNIAALAGGAATILAALCLMKLEKVIQTDKARAMRALALLVALCSLCYSLGYGVVAATGSEFLPANIDYKLACETAAATAEIADTDFYRIDSGASTDNCAPALGYNGMAYYWSMIPSWITKHYTDLELSMQRWSFRVNGMGADSYLDALAGARYCLREQKQLRETLPIGCEPHATATLADGSMVDIYKNDLALPLGYAFDSELNAADYAMLTPLEKRQALVKYAIVEQSNAGHALDGTEFAVSMHDWTLASADNASIEGNVIRGEKGGTLTLRFAGEADAEYWLRLKGCEVLESDIDTDLMIVSLTDAGLNAMYLICEGGVFNYPQSGACLRLGYSEGGMSECTLHFSDAGAVRFDSLEILSTPAQYLRDAIAQRQSNVWLPQMEKNALFGGMRMRSDGILQIALPYSSGWSARVDGEKAELIHCGGMYMGLRLEAGEHNIEMEYETPGLRLGAYVSLSALLLTACLLIISARRRRSRG